MKKTTKKQATRKSDAKKSTRKELRQVGRSKTFDEIIEKIRENVTSGKWRPGDKLPSERVLCEELGVSRFFALWPDAAGLFDDLNPE